MDIYRVLLGVLMIGFVAAMIHGNEEHVESKSRLESKSRIESKLF